MRLMLFAAAMVSAAPAAAQSPVAVHVAIATPPGANRAVVESGMTKSVPLYQSVPGLIRKYYSIDDGSFGGIYLFKDRASAQAWFSDAWRTKATQTYGAAPTVRYFDVPLVVDNSAAAR